MSYLRIIGGNNITIFLGDSVGGFLLDSIYTVGNSPTGIAISDFNGDTYYDIGISNSNSDSISILLGAGDGTFNTTTSVYSGSGLMKMTQGDFNGDNKVDLIAANNNQITLFNGNGDGSFQSGINFSTGSCCTYFIKAADLNNDTNLDVVIGNFVFNGDIAIYYGDGSGNLTLNSSYPYQGFVNNINVTDFDLDNDIDIILSHEDTLRALSNQGAGVLIDSILFQEFQSSGFDFEINDIDSDGDYDFVCSDGDTLRFLRNILSELTLDTTIFLSPSPGKIVIDTFDTDNLGDIAVLSGNTMSILLTFPKCTISYSSDIITACENYTWIDGVNYTASNSIATYTLSNVAGCDSIVTLDLTLDSVDNEVTQAGALLTATESGVTYQWLDCPEMTHISGATSQSFTATANGDYAVIVSNNACSDTSTCNTVTGVGIIENDFGSGLLLYPNPTNGNFSIDLGEIYKSVYVTITDIKGKQIQSKTYNGLQWMNLKIEEPAGVYFLIIESAKKKATIRLVKE